MLFRSLHKQPLADTLDELQAQVDALDRLYNTQRFREAARADHGPHGVGTDPQGRSTSACSRIAPNITATTFVLIQRARKSDAG
jgi:hypothetical protein